MIPDLLSLPITYLKLTNFEQNFVNSNIANEKQLKKVEKVGKV